MAARDEQRGLERLLIRREVAEHLRVSVETVRRLTRSGDLPVIRLGQRSVRYRPGDVAKLAGTVNT